MCDNVGKELGTGLGICVDVLVVDWAFCDHTRTVEWVISIGDHIDVVVNIQLGHLMIAEAGHMHACNHSWMCTLDVGLVICSCWYSVHWVVSDGIDVSIPDVG